MAKKGFVIHHNGPPADCVGRAHTRCEAFWRAVKNYHMNNNGWSDIAYSFGVCPHGIVFTGRGWYKNQFANGKDVVGPDDGADAYWYTVLTFIGIGEKPTDAMVASVQAVIELGRTEGLCGQRVLPHNAFKVKPCPGPEFTAYAKAWDNQPITMKESVVDALTRTSFLYIVAALTGLTSAQRAKLIDGGTDAQPIPSLEAIVRKAVKAELANIVAGDGATPDQIIDRLKARL